MTACTSFRPPTNAKLPEKQMRSVRLPVPWERAPADNAETATLLGSLRATYRDASPSVDPDAAWASRRGEAALVQSLLMPPSLPTTEYPTARLTTPPPLSRLLHRDGMEAARVSTLWRAITKRELKVIHFADLPTSRPVFRKFPMQSHADADGVIIRYDPPQLVHHHLSGITHRINAVDGMCPLVRALGIMAEFMAVHPYRDGNGRLGRLLFQGILGQADVLPGPVLPLGLYTYINADRFVGALQALQVDGDWQPLHRFVVLMLERLLAEAGR